MGSLIATLITFLIDLVWKSTWPARTSLLALGYALFAACLTSFLVAWITVHLAIWQNFERHRHALALMGISTPDADEGVMIIIPDFPITPPGGHDRDQSLDLPPLKGLENLGVHAYSKNDVNLLVDIMRIFEGAGLRSPLLYTDSEFMDHYRMSLAKDLDYRNAKNCRDPKGGNVAIRHIICIGLWSNELSVAVLGGGLPIQLVGTGPTRKVRVKIRAEYQDVDAGPRDDSHGKERTFALLMRTQLLDVSLVVLGGTRGTGGARMGQLLHGLFSEAKELWSIDPNHDLWATLLVPGVTSPDASYEVTSLRSHAGLDSRRRKLSHFVKTNE